MLCDFGPNTFAELKTPVAIASGVLEFLFGEPSLGAHGPGTHVLNHLWCEAIDMHAQ